MTGVDPRRFGPYAGAAYVRAKNEESYRKVFTVHFPDEERAAARPLRRAPCYDRLKAQGAVFGSVYGWERPGWFAPPGYALAEAEIARPEALLNPPHDEPEGGAAPRERWSFRRANYFPHVGRECRLVRDAAGLLDMSAFAKYSVCGRGAEAWLNRIFANRMPRKTGGLALCHMLSPSGGVRAEATILRQGEQDFYLVMAGALERHDWDYLSRLTPQDGGVRLQNITTQLGVFVLAGPRARDILQAVTDADLSNAAFPWLTGRKIDVGYAQATALRVNYVGELGWELHHPIEMQNTIYDTLMQAGKSAGLGLFGLKAMDSLRLEKSYRAVGREMSIEYSAWECGLDRFVRMDKADFTGRQALLARRGAPAANRFVTLEIHDVTDADARGSEPIQRHGELVGRTTSGGYGWRVEKSLALAMVRPDLGEPGSELEAVILGTPHRATVVAESPYDPGNIRLKA
jgi:dimethylglycine dehydrogenase